MAAVQYGATPYNTYKRKRAGESWTDDWKNKPILSLDIRNNNPHFSIFTNNPKEQSKEVETRPGVKRVLSQLPITCRMGPEDLEKLIILFRRVSATNEPTGYAVRFRGPVYDKQTGTKVPGEFETKTILDFGRDPEGIIYLRFAEKGREKPLFKFTKNGWVPVTTEGAEFSVADDSTLEFEAFVNSMDRILGTVYTQYFVPEEQRQARSENDEVQTMSDVASKNPSASVPAEGGWD